MIALAQDHRSGTCLVASARPQPRRREVVRERSERDAGCAASLRSARGTCHRRARQCLRPPIGLLCVMAKSVRWTLTAETSFYPLMFRRETRPFFYAFDLLAVDGEDVTRLPLLERKRRLRAIVPRVSSRLLYLDAIRERGTELFRLACELDLEGIVGKWSRGTYQCDGRRTSWLKIKNPNYSQIEGRRELFEARRDRGSRKQETTAPELCLA